MRRTYSQRIISILMNQEQKNEEAIFHSRIASRRFRKVRNIDNSVMRTARRMRSKGILRRVSPGKYVLTANGRQLA